MACKQRLKEASNYPAQKQQLNQTSTVVVKELQETVSELKTTLSAALKKLEIKMLDINTAGQNQLLKTIDLLKMDLQDKTKEIQEKFSGILDLISAQMQMVKKEVEEIKEERHAMDVRIKKLEQDNVVLRQQLESQEQDKILSQFRVMEYAVRIRGVKEDDNQNFQEFQEMCAQNLSTWTGMDKVFLLNSFEKIYRVNSPVAKERNLPRDIVIYFDRRLTRNKVCQSVFNKKLQYAGLDVILMKEIPPKMLLKRKEFSFLTIELRRRGYLYRWDFPTGLVVSYSGQRHRLDTLDKAKEFYTKLVKDGHRGQVILKDEYPQQEGSASHILDKKDMRKNEVPEKITGRQQEQLKKRPSGFEKDFENHEAFRKKLFEIVENSNRSLIKCKALVKGGV